MKPLDFRPRAVEDLHAAIDYYLQEAAHVAARFEAAINEAVSLIARAPGVGSPSLADLLDIEGLRFVPLENFPYAIFYRDFGSEIRVLRLLHRRRDLANLAGLDD